MVKNRISSQYVFGYQKFILYPEDYKTTKTGKKKVSLPELVGKGYGTFWRWKGRYRVCKGSRASKKSKTTALWYITNIMKYPDANALVVRKTFRTLKDSCFTELKWAIHRLGVDVFWEIKESPLEMTYKPTGQKIYFRGLDDPLKVTSITVDVGCLCWMWIEEAYEISSEDDFNMLDESIRGAVPEGSGLFKQITLTLNPWNEHHWIKKRFFDNPDDETLAMTTNYKCNEWLDAADLKVFETMRKQNPRRYKVAGLGDWGIVDGLVYENWEEKAFSIDEVKAIKGVKSVFGLDFGYTNDPSALFCGFIDQASKTIWVFDEMYKPGMSNEAIADEVQRMGYVKEKITADSAEPKSIDRLRELGLKGIRKARKGKDSINNGIDFIQDYHIIVHPRCVNFITEISNYTWDTDTKTGNGTWVKQLENASARYHISRLEALKLQTQQSIEAMFGNQLDSIDSAMRNIYTSGYYRTAFEIQKGVGVGWDFATLDEKQISKIINKPWAVDGKNFSERIWGNRQKLVNELNTELTRNVILGQNPQKAIDAIARKMNTSKNVAGRLVMTEEAFFSSAAQKDCFGVVKYGHGGKYYQSVNSRVHETIANYAALSVTRPDLIELLRADKPELVAELDAVIVELLKKAGGE